MTQHRSYSSYFVFYGGTGVHPVGDCCCFSADTPYVTPISSILMLTTRVVTGTQGGHNVRRFLGVVIGLEDFLGVVIGLEGFLGVVARLKGFWVWSQRYFMTYKAWSHCSTD